MQIIIIVIIFIVRDINSLQASVKRGKEEIRNL